MRYMTEDEHEALLKVARAADAFERAFETWLSSNPGQERWGAIVAEYQGRRAELLVAVREWRECNAPA